ncbi:hypothetical protein DEI97_013535 [Curtobacterium sp. MCLR17_032]|nr:hypothetical protein [Curtobacterium sp. MCLR17_032]WIE60763.1 hypothetical protein DEI97_013535 [Curtobacterium sp. MCLR17_032]
METMTSTAGRHRGYITSAREAEDLEHLRFVLTGLATPGAGRHKAAS